MDDERFDEEVATAEQGDWAALGLDALPAGWKEASIEDLRDA